MDWSTACDDAKHKDAAPPERFVSTVWAMRGLSEKPVLCEAWEVATGLELRLMRDGQMLRSQLCRGGMAEAATHADEWAMKLRAAGFREVDA